MWGRATLVMLVSSTCITVTIITEKVMAHFRAALIGASVAGAGGGVTSPGYSLTAKTPNRHRIRRARGCAAPPPVDEVHQAAVVEHTSLLDTRSAPAGTGGRNVATSRGAWGLAMSTMRSPWANHATGISVPRHLARTAGGSR